MDNVKEVLGFICRWYILVLAFVCVLAVIWVGLLAGNADAQAENPQLVMSGGIFRQGRDVNMIGSYSPASSASCSRIIGGSCGEESSLAYTSGHAVSQFVVAPAVGDNNVFVRGLPYGPLAFCRANPHLLVVRDGVPALLIDSRMCISAGAADQRELKSMIDRLSNQAGLALIHGGPTLAAQKADVELRRAGFNLPLIWRSIEKEDWVSSIDTAAATLGIKPKTIPVVTADAGLAEMLSGKGYAVELIGRSAPASSGGKYKNLHRWDSIQQYANSVSHK